jgi:four helix bundle protein
MNNESEKKEQTGTFFRFEDLRIYHKSLTYINWLQDATMLFPENHNSNLAARFNMSARNIALNIAEGSSRNKSQFVYYLKMAKSAIRECMVYTTISHNAGLFSDEYEDESRGILMEMTKMIGALISSLQRSNGYHNNGNSHHDDDEKPHSDENTGNRYDDDF